MAHAWKACWVHALAGSNPASSAVVTSRYAGPPVEGGPAYRWMAAVVVAVVPGRRPGTDPLLRSRPRPAHRTEGVPTAVRLPDRRLRAAPRLRRVGSGPPSRC